MTPMSIVLSLFPCLDDAIILLDGKEVGERETNEAVAGVLWAWRWRREVELRTLSETMEWRMAVARRSSRTMRMSRERRAPRGNADCSRNPPATLASRKFKTTKFSGKHVTGQPVEKLVQVALSERGLGDDGGEGGVDDAAVQHRYLPHLLLEMNGIGDGEVGDLEVEGEAGEEGDGGEEGDDFAGPEAAPAAAFAGAAAHARPAHAGDEGVGDAAVAVHRQRQHHPDRPRQAHVGDVVAERRVAVRGRMGKGW